MSIIAYVGNKGAGKTYLMSVDCNFAIEHGVSVWANYALKGAHYFTDLDEILNVTNGIVAVDELNSLMPASRWQAAKIDHMNLFSQSRKGDLDLFYTSQSFTGVVNRVRDITDEIWLLDYMFRQKYRRKVQPTWSQKLLQRFHVAKKFTPATLGRARHKPLEVYRFMESEKVYKIYNTKFRIKTARHLRGIDPIEDLDPNELPTFDENLQIEPNPTYAPLPLVSKLPPDVRLPDRVQDGVLSTDEG